MTGRRLTGRMVLAIFLGFFGTILLANGIMMFLAARSYDGVVEADAYRKGRDYNLTLEAAREQERLGWQVDFGEGEGPDGGRRAFARLLDRDGYPLEGYAVSMTYFSPVEEEEDRVLRLVHSGEGVYEGATTLARAGRYVLRLEVGDGERRIYRLEREIMVPATMDGRR